MWRHEHPLAIWGVDQLLSINLVVICTHRSCFGKNLDGVLWLAIETINSSREVLESFVVQVDFQTFQELKKLEAHLRSGAQVIQWSGGVRYRAASDLGDVFIELSNRRRRLAQARLRRSS